MTLNAALTKSICDFVKLKPRTVQEVSEHIRKNWRTAERYVNRIEEETGCLSTRVFREGTRGALKIVYWKLSDDIHSLSFQQELFDEIMEGKRKDDFSPFDIYQYVQKKMKKAHVEDISRREQDISLEQDFVGFLRQTTKQLLIFSGNLSWINGKQGKVKIIDIIRELLARGVSIKIVVGISMVGVDYVQRFLALNKEQARDLIEIRHRRQPLRAMIVDDKIMKLREIRDPAYYKPGELKKKIEIFYEIYDKEWIAWMQKVFWKMFSTGIPAEKRIQEIESIKGVHETFI